MNKNTTFIGQLKRDILKFSEKISDGLGRPMRKFVAQMLYGLLVSQSVMLSDTTRALKEKIPLIKTENRLSRNLKSFYQDVPCAWQNYLEEVKPYVDDETIFCLGPGDICKKYSRCQEGLGWIEDGSTHKPAMGWNLIGVTALTHSKKLPSPVYNELMSTSDVMEEEFTEGLITAIRAVQRTFGGPLGIFTMDRGMDSIEIYKHCFGTKQRFVVRGKVNRNLIVGGESVNIKEIASRYAGKYLMPFTDKHGKKYKLKASFVSVRLPECPDEPLALVVVWL